MTVRERAWWWIGIVALLCGFIWLFKGILLPFVAGIAIAYFLDPLADWMERHGIITAPLARIKRRLLSRGRSDRAGLAEPAE